MLTSGKQNVADI